MLEINYITKKIKDVYLDVVDILTWIRGRKSVLFPGIVTKQLSY